MGIFNVESSRTNRFTGTIGLQGVQFYAGTGILSMLYSGDTAFWPPTNDDQSVTMPASTSFCRLMRISSLA